VIPLRDSRRTRRTPWATWLLAAANVALFVHEISLGDRLPAFLERWAITPAGLLHPVGLLAVLDSGARLLVSLFLHGSLLHLGGNLAFLLAFGDDVEDKLGAWRFLGFYFGCGAVATLGQAALFPRSELPLIGASGALAGVLGAFLVYFPRARLSGVLPLGCLILPARSPAYLFVPVWFLIQLAAAFVELGRIGDSRGGVAWFAHLAGFLAGPPLAWLARRR
jgi:membrane associated rhomboid family serine protease